MKLVSMLKSQLNLLKKFSPDFNQLELSENLEFEVLVFLQKTKTSNALALLFGVQRFSFVSSAQS